MMGRGGEGKSFSRSALQLNGMDFYVSSWLFPFSAYPVAIAKYIALHARDKLSTVAINAERCLKNSA